MQVPEEDYHYILLLRNIRFKKLSGNILISNPDEMSCVCVSSVPLQSGRQTLSWVTLARVEPAG